MHYKNTAMILDYCITKTLLRHWTIASQKHCYDIGLLHYKNTAMTLDYCITKTIL